MSDLIPTHGVRVLLERAAQGDAGATYRVEIHAPDASWRSEARLVVEGAQLAIAEWTAVRGTAPSPEPWMVESARGFLRMVLKNHGQDRDWPARQLRWRDRR